jgi:death-on-curing protein
MTDPKLEFLTPADLYAIAEEVLGRKPDVRDRYLLLKAAARPLLIVFGEEVFPTLMDKAAALLHSLAAHHLFYDGNKRTATAATIRFLRMNGVQPTWDDTTVYDFVLDVAQNKLDVPEIAAWLAEHTEERNDDGHALGHS